MWGPTFSGYAEPHYPNPNKLTLNELMALFGRTPADTRWVSCADSQEYLDIVQFLVANHKPHEGERG